jgi:putative transposase
VRIETPRDRNGSFEPQIVRKGQRRFEGFDEKILALYSRGMSTRDIEAPVRDLRRQGRPRPDQPRHRRGDGGRP